MENLEPLLIRGREYTVTIKGAGFSYPAQIETLNFPLGIALLKTQFSHPHHIKLASSRQEDHFNPRLFLTLDDKARGTLVTEISPHSTGAPIVYSDFTLGGIQKSTLFRGPPLSPSLLNRFLLGYLRQADRQIASHSQWELSVEKMILEKQREIIEEATREPLALLAGSELRFALGLQSFLCQNQPLAAGLMLDCHLSSSLYSGSQLGLGEVRIRTLPSRAIVPEKNGRQSFSDTHAYLNPDCQKFRVKGKASRLDLQICSKALPSLPKLKFVEVTLHHKDQSLVLNFNGFDRAGIQRLLHYYTQVLERAT
jgi:hypothetical protein